MKNNLLHVINHDLSTTKMIKVVPCESVTIGLAEDTFPVIQLHSDRSPIPFELRFDTIEEIKEWQNELGDSIERMRAWLETKKKGAH